MSCKKPVIVPSVQSVIMGEGKYYIPKTVRINFGNIKKIPLFFLNGWLTWEKCTDNADITFIHNSEMHEQGYKIVVKNTVVIEYTEECGAFYALTTLKQLFAADGNGKYIPEATIEDFPEIPQRAVMLDVSRGRITRLEILKKTVDMLAMLKYNQFQLYFDSLIFDYKGFEEYTAGRCVYTAEEIKELNDYCRERFIDLVPNQNSFGHLERWLEQPNLYSIAITRDNGTKSGVLNPLNEDSLKFMDKIYGSLLPYFDSAFINIGCDETGEIGQGETKAECEKIGVGRVYVDFLLKLYKLVTEKYKRTPMFWCDIAMQHPELLPMLPKDLIAIEFDYEGDHPFEERCKILHDAGLRFYVSPGTSGWNSICGRTENMTENLRNAARAAIKYGAEGYLVTDWGDGGHPQPLASSMAGYIIGGMYAWHAESYEQKGVEELCRNAALFANKYIFETDSDFFDFLLRLGKYSNLEGIRQNNSTLTWNNFCGCKPTRFPVIYSYASELMREIENIALNCEYSDLLKGEIKNACRLLMIISEPEKVSGEDELWKKEYLYMWNMRSKPSGADFEIRLMDNFINAVANIKANGEEIPQGVTDIKRFF